jgi:hypothetical protein
MLVSFNNGTHLFWSGLPSGRNGAKSFPSVADGMDPSGRTTSGRFIQTEKN